MKETIVKINKTKSWLFKKINKIDKPLVPDLSIKRENQIHKMKNEKGEVTTYNAEIQRIVRDYYKQLHNNKRDNLKEMIVKINKTKSWFFEKINNIDKPLNRLIKKKERGIKSTKLEMKKVRFQRKMQKDKGV